MSGLSSDLTLLERAKVAAATGAKVEMSGEDFAWMLQTIETLHSSSSLPVELAAKDDDLAARAKRLLGWSIVAFCTGLGLFIAGLIL